MKTLRISIIIFILLSFSVSVRGAGINLGKRIVKGGYVKGEVIVKYKKDIPPERIHSLHQRIKAVKKKDIPSLRIQSVKIPDNVPVEDAVAQYKNNPDIEYAEPNYILRAYVIPNDPSFNLLWGLDNTSNADINAPEAWDITTGCAADVVIAVIDTGVAYNHADLSANIWSNTGETDCLDDIDNDGNGYKNDCRGWDFLDNDNDPTDYNGHGTHVAGTIAARGNNSSGITGVMWCAKIMPLRFLGVSGAGDTANAALAITYAADNGAHIINASWGGPGSNTLYNAINYARGRNVLFVAAAGNDGTNNDSAPSYPASYNLDNIISVAATTQTDGLASFSNYGAASVDVGAPGVSIYSAIPVFSYGAATTLYSSNFDSDTAGLVPSGWSRGGANSTWTVNSASSSSAPNSLVDSPVGSYANNTNAYVFNNTLFSRTGYYDKAYFLNFMRRQYLENNNDYLYVVASPDYADWYDMWSSSSTLTSFTSASVDMTDAVEAFNDYYFGFWLITNSSATNDGVYIDDVQLVSQPISIAGDAYAYYQGTSMAAPHVAGAAGLVKAANPGYTYAQIRETIMTTVDQRATLSGRVFTGGRINAFNALSGSGRPLAPSNLSASAVAGPQVNLSWTDNSSIETGFMIERRTGGGSYSQIAAVGTNTASYTDTAVSANTTYYYRVRASNSAGNSSYSNEASARMPEPLDSSPSGGCGMVNDGRNSRPPMTGMAPLLLPVLWLFFRRMIYKGAKLQILGIK